MGILAVAQKDPLRNGSILPEDDLNDDALDDVAGLGVGTSDVCDVIMWYFKVDNSNMI